MNLVTLFASTSSNPYEYPGMYLFLYMFVYLPAAGATVLFLFLIKFLLKLLPVKYTSKLNLENESFALFPGVIFPGIYLIIRHISEITIHRTDDELLAVVAFVMVLTGSQLIPKLLRRKK